MTPLELPRLSLSSPSHAHDQTVHEAYGCDTMQYPFVGLLQAYAYTLTRSALNEGLEPSQKQQWPALAVESYEAGNASRFINDVYGREGQVCLSRS